MLQEIEAKFCPVDKDECRKKLKELGFQLQQPEFLMKRVTFFSETLTDRWGRVRQEAKNVTMAIKKVVDKTRIDGTEEIEVIIPSMEHGLKFMEACGFNQTSYQENLREIWLQGETEATLDTWP